jgi:NAD(P)-dependent dehydrogenase (short-subunit alcohol dehydrogenase family)
LKDFQNRVALVTGAGSGIGRATALALAREGSKVIATDINLQSAGETASMIRESGQEAAAHALDVADAGQAARLAQELATEGRAPSILVNNAGIGVGGYFIDTSLATWDRIMAINLMGVVHCCRAFVPAMVASGRGGHVVNIASMLGYAGVRGVSAYCATKFGVLGFTESLRLELADHGIGVSAICPGVVRTGIISAGILESSTVDVEARRQSIEAFYRKRNYSPDRVAMAIVRSIRKNRAVTPVTAEAWFAYYAKRWAPWLLAWINRKDRL